MNDKEKKQSPPLTEAVASLFEEARRDAEKLLTLLPRIGSALEVFDRENLQTAWKQNESISKNLDDKTEQLLELCLDNSSAREMESIRPTLNNLHNFKMISKNLAKFMEEIKIRIAEDIMFSDRAYQQLASLWEAMCAIFKQTTECFYRPRREEAEKILARCTQIARLIDQYDIEHEERLIRGVCPLKASSMFLNMLDTIRGIVRCLSNISANF